VIITHELLHTLGASDKYSVEGLPIYPEGFAEANRTPRFPQVQAEIMGGRVPISETQARIPNDLSECILGRLTAQVIGWHE